MPNYSSGRNNSPEQGTYIGFVKDVVDTKHAGRLKVWIPEFAGREEDPNAWILCRYCSPFGGATSWRNNSENEYDNFEKTQQSYGFWAVPPDLDNEVLVVFPNKDLSRAVWVGSVFKEYMNHMIPGVAASNNNKHWVFPVDREKRNIPVAEYNKFDRVSGDTARPLAPVRPWHRQRTESIGNQGLLNDTIRGTTTSSAQRESPSQVYGMNTPGPKSPDVPGARLGGSSFVMDDGEGSEYIGFRTRSGAQIKIDETNGLIYAINKKGTAWIQMDEDGNVDIFSAESISARSKKDINFRADRDINIEAGQNINVKAAMDTDAEGGYVGEGAGLGGDIKVQALNNHHTTVHENQFTTVINGNKNLDVQTGSRFELIETNDNLTVNGSKFETIADEYSISNTTFNISTDDYSLTVANATTVESSTMDVNLSGEGTYSMSGINLTAGPITMDPAGTINATTVIAPTVSAGAIGGGSITTTGGADVDDLKSTLDSHEHKYIDTVSGTGPVEKTTLEHPQAGSPSAPNPPDASPGSPVAPTPPTDAEEVTSAEVKALIEKTDTLATFPDTTIRANGNKLIDIPDWWLRDMIKVETIVERLMTYEPCCDHVNRGIVNQRRQEPGSDPLQPADIECQEDRTPPNS